MKPVLKPINPEKKQTILLVVTFVIIAFLDVVFLLPLQTKSLKQVSVKNAALKKDIDLFSTELAEQEKILADAAKGVKQEKAKPRKLISIEQAPLLMKEISDIANKHKIKIVQIASAQGQPEKEKKSKTTKQAKAAKAAPPSAPFLLVSMEIVSDFHHFGAFINDLENAESFMSVQSVKIARHAINPAAQKTNLVIKAYVRK